MWLPANLNVVAHLAMLKVINGELEAFLLPGHQLTFAVRAWPEHCQRAGGLELGLEPVLGAGGGVGHVDTQAAIFTQDDQGGATKSLQVGEREMM